MIEGAIFGGIIGFFAWLIGIGIAKVFVKDKKRAKKVGQFIFIILLSSGITIINNPNIKQKLAVLINPDLAIMAEEEDKLINLISDPKLQEEARNLSNLDRQKFVMRGLGKLSDEELIGWNSVRINMANYSPDLCSGLWMGDMSGVDLVDILKNLSEADKLGWLKISASALEYELTDKPPFEFKQEMVQPSISHLVSTFSDEEKSRAQLVFSQGQSADKTDACWMIKQMMGLVNTEKSHGINIIKYLAWVSAQAGAK